MQELGPLDPSAQSLLQRVRGRACLHQYQQAPSQRLYALQLQVIRGSPESAQGMLLAAFMCLSRGRSVREILWCVPFRSIVPRACPAASAPLLALEAGVHTEVCTYLAQSKAGACLTAGACPAAIAIWQMSEKAHLKLSKVTIEVTVTIKQPLMGI